MVVFCHRVFHWRRGDGSGNSWQSSLGPSLWQFSVCVGSLNRCDFSRHEQRVRHGRMVGGPLFSSPCFSGIVSDIWWMDASLSVGWTTRRFSSVSVDPGSSMGSLFCRGSSFGGASFWSERGAAGTASFSHCGYGAPRASHRVHDRRVHDREPHWHMGYQLLSTDVVRQCHPRGSSGCYSGDARYVLAIFAKRRILGFQDECACWNGGCHLDEFSSCYCGSTCSSSGRQSLSTGPG